MPSSGKHHATDAFVYEIVDGLEFLVVGLSARTTNAAEAGPDGVISKLWRQFSRGEIPAQELALHESGEILATYTDYERDEHGPYTVTVGYRVTTLDDIPEGLSGAIVPAQIFARVVVEGDPSQAIPEAWEQIWRVFAGEPYRRQFAGEVEVYAKDPVTGASTAEILVGVALR